MNGEENMIAAAARENNPKRSYLAVNRKQGKHVSRQSERGLWPVPAPVRMKSGKCMKEKRCW